ncbi:unnamed protein product, partial [Heterosigma akashiwo]
GGASRGRHPARHHQEHLAPVPQQVPVLPAGLPQEGLPEALQHLPPAQAPGAQAAAPAAGPGRQVPTADAAGHRPQGPPGPAHQAHAAPGGAQQRQAPAAGGEGGHPPGGGPAGQGRRAMVNHLT